MKFIFVEGIFIIESIVVFNNVLLYFVCCINKFYLKENRLKYNLY